MHVPTKSNAIGRSSPGVGVVNGDRRGPDGACQPQSYRRACVIRMSLGAGAEGGMCKYLLFRPDVGLLACFCSRQHLAPALAQCSVTTRRVLRRAHKVNPQTKGCSSPRIGREKCAQKSAHRSCLRGCAITSAQISRKAQWVLRSVFGREGGGGSSHYPCVSGTHPQWQALLLVCRLVSDMFCALRRKPVPLVARNLVQRRRGGAGRFTTSHEVWFCRRRYSGHPVSGCAGLIASRVTVPAQIHNMGIPDVQGFLDKAIDTPNTTTINKALLQLEHLQCLRMEPSSQQYRYACGHCLEVQGVRGGTGNSKPARGCDTHRALHQSQAYRWRS